MTQLAYTLLVALVAAERLVELSIASRNRSIQLARGGIEYGAEHYPIMVALHTALLIGCVAETWLLDRPFLPWLGIPMLGTLILAQSLRYWVVATLGRRWTTRVVIVPGDERIDAGPFRFLSHPNYAAVVVEGLALPLVHSNWLTATVFTVANALLLRRRIRIEDEALRAMEAAR